MPKHSTIEKVITRSKTNANPTIIKFQSGTPLETDNEVRFATEKEDPSKNVMLVAYRGQVNTIYRGNVNENPADELVGTYIAIRNKTTNKVRMIEVDQCLVKSSHHYEKPEVSKGLEIDARSLLLKNFGSKAALRAIERREKSVYNSSFVDTNLNDTVKSVPDIDDVKMETEVNEVTMVNSVKSSRNKRSRKA